MKIERILSIVFVCLLVLGAWFLATLEPIFTRLEYNWEISVSGLFLYVDELPTCHNGTCTGVDVKGKSYRFKDQGWAITEGFTLTAK